MTSALSDLARFLAELARSVRRVMAGGLLEVLAIELAARILSTLLIGLAGTVGATSAVGGLAITAVASLLRLVAMVLQILVLLRWMRSTPEPLLGERRVQAALSGMAAAVLPAFVLLTAWGLLADDLRDYSLAALGAIDWFQEGAGVGGVLDVPVDVLTVGLLVGCLILRGVLRRFERRGRKGLAVVALLLEGIWAYLAVSILADVVGLAGDWFATTRLASWVDAAQDALRGALGDLPADAWTWLGQTWHVLTVPIVWLTLVGIVLVGARPEVVPEGREPMRVARWWSRLVDALPSPLDDALQELTDDLHDRWVPVASTIRQVWRAGLVPMACAVLLWYVLDAAASWLTVLLMHALGPRPLPLAEAVANAGAMLGDTIGAALGLAFAVAALDALRLRAVPRAVAPAVAPAAPPASSSPHRGAPDATRMPQTSSGTARQTTSPPTSSRASSIDPAGSTNPTTPTSGDSSA